MTPSAFHKLAVQKTARAILMRGWPTPAGYTDDDFFAGMCEGNPMKWQTAVADATAALSAFARLAAEHGFKLLSGEATEGMAEDGSLVETADPFSDRRFVDDGDARAVWTAMHAAAPDMLRGE